MRLNKSLAVAFMMFFLAGACTTTFKPTSVDSTTRRYTTRSEVKPSDIKTRKPFNVDSARKILFVRTNLSEIDEYDQYFETSLKNIGFFEQVLRKDEFERMLVRDKHTDEVPSVDGFAGLARATKIYGPFLVVDFDAVGKGGYDVQLKMTVYDAATAEELLRVDRTITNWGGLDSVLFQPVFNAFVAWLDENSPTFPSPSPAKPAAEAPPAKPGTPARTAPATQPGSATP